MRATVSQILKEAKHYDPKADIVRPLKKRFLVREISALNVHHQASQGELSWISSSNLKSFRTSDFKGSLLVAARSGRVKQASSSAFILTDNPKLVFAKIVRDFFRHLTKTDMPGLASHPVAADTVIKKGVVLCKGAVVGPGVTLQKNVVVGCNTVLAHCEVGEGTVIGANCSIGFPGFGFVEDKDGSFIEFPHVGRVVIGKNVRIGNNTCIDRGALGNTEIGDGVKIDNLVHIAHNVTVGRNTLIIANTMVGGSTSIGENVWVSPSVSLLNKIKVGDGALLGMGAVILHDAEEKSVVVGNPGRVIKKINTGK